MRRAIVIVSLTAQSLCAATVEYEYDDRSQLMRVTRDGMVEHAYAYDLAGNLRWASDGGRTNVFATNELNQYTSMTDADGVVREFAYDADGNMTSDARFAYRWDSACRLTESSPIGGGGGVIVRNWYDDSNRRVKKEVWQCASSASGQPERLLSSTTFVYDGLMPLLETIVDATGGVFRTEYVWGKDISGTLEEACGVGGLLGVVIDGVPYAAVYEDGGNVVAYRASGGRLVASRRYSPFGRMEAAPQGRTALSRRLHIWFSTKYLDLETGLYYFGGRFYSPFLCRWLNRDPIGEGGGANLYAFCRNDPLNKYDKDGCAYFAKRGLGPLPRMLRWSLLLRSPVLGAPIDLAADRYNVEIAHEQLFFEDGRDNPSSIGWSKDGFLENEGTDGYVIFDRGYNDCIMREAVNRVTPDHYQMTWIGGRGKLNCQDYADALRRKYWELMKDPDVYCKCQDKGSVWWR